MKAKIAPALSDLRVKIADTKPHPRNPRQGDVGAISESLRLFGQLKPIVVQKSTGFVVAGNHVREGALSLGWEEIAAVLVDLDNDQAARFLLADNRLSDLGTYNDSALSSLLSDLARDGLLDGTGYDGEDVDRLMADLRRETDIDSAVEGIGRGEQGRGEAGPKAGEAGLVYNIAFDNPEQRDRWYNFLRNLRLQHPDEPTHAARIDAHIASL